MMGLGVFVGILVSSGFKLNYLDVILGGLVGFLLNGSAMILNDIVDIDIDRINRPDRPLVTGAVSIGEAKILFLTLTATGLIISVYLGFIPFLIALTSSIMADLYNLWGKKTGLPGNLMVAFTTAAPFLFGGAIAGSGWGAVEFLALLAFLSNVGREIIKGIADVAGDSVRNVRTVALTLGLEKGAVLGATFIVLAVLLSPLPYIEGYLNQWYMAVVGLADLIFLYLSIKIVRDATPRNARRVKTYILYAMLLSLIAFIIGKL